MNEPKYQWSKFGGPDRNEQYVVREDDFDVFKDARTKIMTEFFPSLPTYPDPTVPAEVLAKQQAFHNQMTVAAQTAAQESGLAIQNGTAPGDPTKREWFTEPKPTADDQAGASPVTEGEDPVKLCPLHQSPMKPKVGSYGPFWSHGKKLDDGTWQNCNGKTGWK